MAVPEITSTLHFDGEWRTKYRELCREFDDAKSLERDLRTTLAKLLGAFKGGAVGERQMVNESVAALREVTAPLNAALLHQAVDHCLTNTESGPSNWSSLQALVAQLKLPPAQEFALKHLRERGRDGSDQVQWIAQLTALLNEPATIPARADGDSDKRSQASHLASLLDWLLLPPDFERQAAQLRDALSEGESDDPVHDTGSFLNDLYAFLRRDLRSLVDYLKKATLHLNSVEVDLKHALRGSQEAESASVRLTSVLSTELEAIDRAVNGDLCVSELKETLDTGVRSIRATITAYIDVQRGKQADYEQCITKLATRVKNFEQESDTLRQGLLAEQEKACRDTLTDLPNRLAYDERAQLEFERSRRSQVPLTLAVLDLDGFKRINDSLGHKVGDKVLRHAAALCRRRTRATDLLARFGGDEFVVLFPDTALALAAEVCEELRRQVEQVTFQYQGQRVPVTVSIGVAELAAGESLEALFERADRALYAAKHGGRNQVVSADFLAEVPPTRHDKGPEAARV